MAQTSLKIKKALDIAREIQHHQTIIDSADMVSQAKQMDTSCLSTKFSKTFDNLMKKYPNRLFKFGASTESEVYTRSTSNAQYNELFFDKKNVSDFDDD